MITPLSITEETKDRIYGLDLLRGLCAVMVSSYHILSWDKVADFTAVGYYGVYIFFVLSGFSIHYRYKTRLVYIKDLSHFFALRFVRLFPLLFLVTSIKYLNVPFLSDSYCWLILTLSCFYGFGMPGATSAVTGGWSLGVEFGLYIFYPFLMSMCKKQNIYVFFLLLFFLLRIAFIKISYLEFEAYWWFGYTQILPFLFFFLAGMYCCEVYKKYTWIHSQILGNIMYIFSLPFLFLLLIFYDLSHKDILSGWLGCMLTLHSIICVFLFSYIPVESNYYKRVCEFSGNISYGVYLIHPIVYHLINKLNLLDPGIVSLILCITVSSFAASIIKKIFEDPIQIACRVKLKKNENRKLLV